MKKTKYGQAFNKMRNCGQDSNACGGALYGLGFVGAAIYYVTHTAGFWSAVLGVLKAMVWPAFLVYKMLEFLGM